ncbi:hypothetical protein [Aestuariivirga sp.]|uniref:hypothetical protein n=1 Tax=Aestuariivirga sp. TaxID=2650926 RepID=UPI003919B8AD
MNARNRVLPAFRLFFHEVDRKGLENATREIEALMKRRVRLYSLGSGAAVELNDELELDALRKHFGERANIRQDLR